MKLLKRFFLFLFSIVFMGISAQIQDPVKFKLNINDLGKWTIRSRSCCDIGKGWHI